MTAAPPFPHETPRRRTAPRMMVGVIALVFGVLLMHGVGNSAMHHGAVPGMAQMNHGRHSHHEVQCPEDSCGHPDNMAIGAMSCALAVVQTSSTPVSRNAEGSKCRYLDAWPSASGILRGPEPPVPRLV